MKAPTPFDKAAPLLIQIAAKQTGINSLPEFKEACEALKPTKAHADLLIPKLKKMGYKEIRYTELGWPTVA